MSSLLDAGVIAAGCGLIGGYAFFGPALHVRAATALTQVTDRITTRHLERRLEKVLGFEVTLVNRVGRPDRETLADWSRAAVPSLGIGEQLILVDHAECENPDCEQIICCCPRSVDTGVPCRGTVFQDCPHLNMLHGDCRLAECVWCRDDARQDAGCRS